MKKQLFSAVGMHTEMSNNATPQFDTQSAVDSPAGAEKEEPPAEVAAKAAEETYE